MHNYKFLERKLHSFILSNKFLRYCSFKIEKELFLRSSKKYCDDRRHVFITGLPRSGTTIILNYLYASSQFASSTFNDMPFVLSPNIWSFCTSKIEKKEISIERKHNDGIKYNFSSPEALEEVFWKTFSNEQSIFEFESYIRLILLKNTKKRYLSKNNYNYNRINKIHSIFPKASFLFIFREPLQTSLSLLKIHKKFSKIQTEDSFVRRYMNWLGHYEFGLDHKPWSFSKSYKKFDSINYWLEQWFLFYSKVLKEYEEKKYVIFINYEKLNSKIMWKDIFKKLDLRYYYKKNFFKISNTTNIPHFDKDLYKKSRKIYEKLLTL